MARDDGLGREIIPFTKLHRNPQPTVLSREKYLDSGEKRILSFGCSLAASGSTCILLQPEKFGGRRDGGFIFKEGSINCPSCTTLGIILWKIGNMREFIYFYGGLILFYACFTETNSFFFS